MNKRATYCQKVHYTFTVRAQFTGRPSRLLYDTDPISASLVRELPNCSNLEYVHCLDVYTIRSLFMSIVHRPSETVSF